MMVRGVWGGRWRWERGDVAQADHGRDSHGAGDDGGMAGAAADIGGKAADVNFVEGGGLGRQQVVGDDDDVALEMKQAFLLLADEAVENSPLDILDIFDGSEERRVGKDDGARGVGG